MNDPLVATLMPMVRQWTAMPVDQAKAHITAWMKAHDRSVFTFDPAFEELGPHQPYEALDYELVEISETVEEAVGLVFGV